MSRFLHPNVPGGLLSLARYLQTITNYTPAAAGTASLDMSKGLTHSIQMPAGNITVAFLNVVVGMTFSVRVIQDAVGSRTVTWPSGIHWPGGSPIVLTLTSNHWDVIDFVCTASGTYDAYIAGANLS